MEQNDKLHKMFVEQKEFQKNFYNPDDISEADRIKLSKEFILSVHRELGEVLNEMPWKLHRAGNVQTHDTAHIQEELIDCLKFMMNLFIVWGMSEDDVYNMFMSKSKVVKDRYDEEKKHI